MGMRGTSIASGVYYDNSNTTWFHILGSYEAADDIKLYVNGSLDGANDSASNNISDFADSDYFYIGTGVNSGTDIAGKTWEGGIAEVAAYAAELTAGEIAALAAGFSPLLVRPSALVGYWPLGGPYDPTTIDPVGSNTLTANGGASAEAHPPKIFYPTAPWSFGVVEEEEDDTVKGFVFESMQMVLTQGGRRRYNVADSPTASTNKGWSFESLQAMITQGGARRK